MRTKYVLLTAAAALPFLALAAKKETAPAAPPSLKEQMLAHVEKVVVVDSIAVDKKDFFKAYKLRPSAGKILDSNEVTALLAGTPLPKEFSGKPHTGFTNEFEDYLIWAQPDADGHFRLAESVRLMDGTWSQPEFTSAVLNLGVPDLDDDDDEDDDDEDDDGESAAESHIRFDAAFPFMADDGQTLYYASDNELSVGGLDIFVATRDPADGEFLIPSNIGLPFNSEYDDYMMALDTETGVGWWATDRNRLEDMITIYVFALSDERVNINPDDEDILAYADLYGWKELLDDEDIETVNRLSSEIASIKTPDRRKPDFELPMPGGRYYRYFTDFKNPQAANTMMLYLEEKGVKEKKEARLDTLRKKYHEGDKALGTEIEKLEEQLRETESNLRALRSEIYKLENQ